MAKPKRGADGLFSITITIGRDGTGKRQRKRIRSKTLAGLREKEAAFRAEQSKGTVTIGKKPSITEFLNQWLADVVKLRNRPRTYERYAGDVKHHIIPAIGALKLDKLTTPDVQRMLNDLAKQGNVKANETTKQGLAPRSVRNVHATLRQALNTAIKWGLVSRNVAEGAAIPKAEKPNRRSLTPKEARSFLEAVRGTRLGALYWVALLLGLRQGEILGLKWENVDFEEGLIIVDGAVQRQKQEEGTSKLVHVSTKTAAGQRVLPLPDVLADILKAHLAQQDEERKHDLWREHGYVFASEVGTPLEAQNLIHRSFKPALQRAKLPNLPFHALRHSAATLLLSLGVNTNTVSAILGHTSAGFTLSTYGHALPELTRSAVDNLGDLLKSDRILELPRRNIDERQTTRPTHGGGE